MVRFVVRPRSFLSWHIVKREDVYVGLAHEVHAKNLDTVVQMAATHCWVVAHARRLHLGGVLRIRCLAELVEALELVEYFEADSVAGFPGLGVGGFEGVVGLLELREVLD